MPDVSEDQASTGSSKQSYKSHMLEPFLSLPSLESDCDSGLPILQVRGDGIWSEEPYNSCYDPFKRQKSIYSLAAKILNQNTSNSNRLQKSVIIINNVSSFQPAHAHTYIVLWWIAKNSLLIFFCVVWKNLVTYAFRSV